MVNNAEQSNRVTTVRDKGYQRGHTTSGGLFYAPIATILSVLLSLAGCDAVVPERVPYPLRQAKITCCRVVDLCSDEFDGVVDLYELWQDEGWSRRDGVDFIKNLWCADFLDWQEEEEIACFLCYLAMVSAVWGPG